MVGFQSRAESLMQYWGSRKDGCHLGVGFCGEAKGVVGVGRKLFLMLALLRDPLLNVWALGKISDK